VCIIKTATVKVIRTLREAVGGSHRWIVWATRSTRDQASFPLCPRTSSVAAFMSGLSKVPLDSARCRAVLLFGLDGFFGAGIALSHLLGELLCEFTLGLRHWLVNSATHLWAPVALKLATIHVTTGGWLCSPVERAGTTTTRKLSSARHGIAWYEIDPNYWGIWLLF